MCLPVFQNGMQLLYTTLAKQAHDALTELDHLVLQNLMTEVLEDPTGLPWMLAGELPLYGARLGGIYVTYHLVDEVVLVTQVTSHRERGDSPHPTPDDQRGSRPVLESLFADVLTNGELIRVRHFPGRIEPWRGIDPGKRIDTYGEKPRRGIARRKASDLLPPELGG